MTRNPNPKITEQIRKIDTIEERSENTSEALAHNQKISGAELQQCALKEALILLNKKKISCFFFHRVGNMDAGFAYEPTAVKRMEQKLTFPMMSEEPDIYTNDFRELLEEKYSPEYIRLLKKIPQIVYKGNVYAHEDFHSELVNVIGGKRITAGSPKQYDKTIHMYGRCGVFGYAVEDADTLPSSLQQQLIQHGYDRIRVVNHGLWGGDDNCIIHNFLHDMGEFKPGDIVLFYLCRWKRDIMEQLMECGLEYFDTTEDWHTFPESRWCFYNQPGHMNRTGYHNLSQVIFRVLEKYSFTSRQLPESKLQSPSALYLNQYLKSTLDDGFFKSLDQYLSGIQKQYPVDPETVCGSIVMNCNPFTRGHRYLIEYASRQVERLYIFVVEEDKSFFPFAARFQMVQEGTKDLPNVIVIPSGKFMISSLTFPEYFLKDYVKEKNFDVSGDLDIFGKYIAPQLNISVRFAGEEPFDVITQNYNESMRQILPSYGVRFMEIPRLQSDHAEIISATRVRALMQEKNYEIIRNYVPDSTYPLLQKFFTI